MYIVASKIAISAALIFALTSCSSDPYSQKPHEFVAYGYGTDFRETFDRNNIVRHAGGDVSVFIRTEYEKPILRISAEEALFVARCSHRILEFKDLSYKKYGIWHQREYQPNPLDAERFYGDGIFSRTSIAKLYRHLCDGDSLESLW